MHTSPSWLDVGADPSSRWPVAAWTTVPGQVAGLGVLLLPPLSYEYSSGYRFMRSLAESLARRGAVSLRCDYPANGDSGGEAVDISSPDPWRAVVPAGVDALRARGMSTVVVLGCHMGGTFALLDGPAAHADGIVAIAPVLSGRRLVRSMKLIGVTGPEGIRGVSQAGHYFTEEILGELGRISVLEPASPRTLIVDAVPEVRSFLEQPAEAAVVDDAFVERIAEKVFALAEIPVRSQTACSVAEQNVSASERHNGASTEDDPWVRIAPEVEAGPRAVVDREGAISEMFVRVGAHKLVGVVTIPDEGAASVGRIADSGALYVLPNSGSDPHSGPGRAWVELARYLARHGMATLRFDFRGWGESPAGPTSPAAPYDPHCGDDMREVVSAVQALWPRVFLGGLCSSSWFSFHLAPEIDGLAGVVALSPQLYRQPGDPVDLTLAEGHARRAAERAWIKAEEQTGRWDEEDRRGLRPPAARLLEKIVDRGVPVSAVFAESDDGLEYLRDRLGRRLRILEETGLVRVVEVPDVDHGMHRAWLKPRVFDVIARELARALARVEENPPLRGEVGSRVAARSGSGRARGRRDSGETQGREHRPQFGAIGEPLE